MIETNRGPWGRVRDQKCVMHILKMRSRVKRGNMGRNQKHRKDAEEKHDYGEERQSRQGRKARNPKASGGHLDAHGKACLGIVLPDLVYLSSDA